MFFVYVIIYVYVCNVCIYVHMHYVHMYHVCTYVCMYVSKNIHIYACSTEDYNLKKIIKFFYCSSIVINGVRGHCTRVIYTFWSALSNVCVCVCVCVDVRAHVSVDVYVYVYVCVYVCVHV